MTTPTNYDDVIDSREVIERIEELAAEMTDLQDALTAAQEETDAPAVESAQAAIQTWQEENQSELDALRGLQDDAEGYSEDWKHGATLVRDSYFVQYAQELLQDIGDLPKNLPHYIEIDWEATARNIRMDYTGVEFDGITYWIR